MGLAGLLAFLLLPAILWAQNASSTFHIKYVTGETVYLDAGSADSLAVGDSLDINNGDSVIARIEVIFVAEHSSSCKIVSTSREIKIGDPAKLRREKILSQDTVFSMPARDSSKAAPAEEVMIATPAAKKPNARIYGSIALGLYHFSDRSAANLDFTQPSLRVNLRATRLFGRDLTFAIRSDSRYNRRSRSYNNNVPQSEWRNRFYQFSLSSGSKDSPYNFEFGRVISNSFSGIGYIDGFLAQRRINNAFRVGGFGGTQPQWQYSGFQTSLQKYGAFGTLTLGNYQGNRLESTAALAGEYHGPTVSREFVFWRNSLNLGRVWSFYQSSEIDMNRSWRKDKAGQSFSITNLYFSVRGKLASWLKAGLSFDSRKSYWTFETRSLADSLFDSALRNGLRADLTLRPANTLTIFTNFGYNKRTSDRRATYSGGAGINKSNFLFAGQFVNIQAAGFSAPFSNGINGSVTVGRYLWRANLLSIVYGAYNYGYSGTNRFNQWFQGNGQFNLLGKTYFRGTFEYDTGDDTSGNRIIGEIGYRL